tara:strand:- start:1008 stop:1448 length:441 start_codon:yes stop_codon:yes gene_type:complete
MRIAIVSSMFNEEISNNLISGAMQCYNDITNQDFDKSNIFKVPGAFEIPFLVKKLLSTSSNNFDAIVTLGCVIKGETAHFEYISESVTRAIMELNLNRSFDIPIIYGVLTAYYYEQALNRCLNDKTNKGYEVMESAIKMIDLNNSL